MNAMEKFMEILPVFIIFPVIAYIVKMSLDYFTRKKMIEKGLVGKEALELFKTNSEIYLPSSLKWGMVLVFVGVVIVILKLLPVFVSTEVAFGAMLIAAGSAMLIYYALATMKSKEKNRSKIE